MCLRRPAGSFKTVSLAPCVPLLCSYYGDYLGDEQTARFVQRVSSRYTVATLERLTYHGLREVRRASVLALGMLGDYESNAVLGRALNDDDRVVRNLAENGIRSLWLRHGSEEDRQHLAVVIRLNFSQHYAEAVEKADQLLTRATWLAEAWNQRAIAHYNLGRYLESIDDCSLALEINPYHFGAAAGMGQAFLHLGKTAAAVECFRRALRLNPSLEGIRAGVAYLEKSLRPQGGT